MRRLWRLTGVLLFALMLGPPAASAWFVDRGFGGEFGVNQLTVVASPGETNNFEIFVSGSSSETGTLSIVDRNFNPVQPGGACGPFPGLMPGYGVGATCGSYAQLGGGVLVTLGDGNDRVDIFWPFRSAGFPQVSATGGDGNDELIGGQGISRLDGGPGDDRLGADSPCCSEPFEAGDDTFLGGAGNDKMAGGEGNDDLEGGEGNDRIFGDRGDPDRAGNDQIDGGDGNDVIAGDDGSDVLLGSGGLDQLSALDGEKDQKIDCGPGLNKKEPVFWDYNLKKSKRDPKPISCKKTKRKRKKK